MQMISFDTEASEALIMPVGDIQWTGGDEDVALEMLKKHITWGVEHGAYFIGMGDYIDTFSPSNRARLGGAALYDSALKALDADAKARVDELYRAALAPSRGRWLGLLEGHHYHEFRDRTTSDQLLASMLDAPFLGTNAYVKLGLVTGGTSRGSAMIWAHHGTGSGSTAGAALNRLERVTKSFDADIFLMGHQHTKDAKPIDYIRPVYPQSGRPHLVHATKMLVVTGSFLKGYIVDRMDGPVERGGYVEQKMLNPVALGGVLVKVRLSYKHYGDHRALELDINAEV